jgi:CheY-like chemotaxis protein
MKMCDAPMRVLVVEDCPDTGDSLRVLLQMWGYDVRVARTAAAGLTLAEQFRPAVALIDLGLPGTDGFQVARHLQLLPPEEMPILVAATGHVAKDSRQRAWEAGFDHFVPKPFDVEHLRQILAGPSWTADPAFGCSPPEEPVTIRQAGENP